MSSLGFVEFIALLLSLGNFGVSANTQAPSAAEVMQYAPADADIVIHADLQALVSSNYKALEALPGSEAIKKNPRAQEALEGVLGQIRMGASMVKGFTGIDPIADVHSVSAWLKLPSAGDPEILVVVRGNMTPEIVARIAQTMGGTAAELDGNKVCTAPDGTMALGIKNKALLFGTTVWVRERLGKGWKAAKPASGARLAELFKARPFFLLASMPSQIAVTRMSQELSDSDNVALDLVRGHEFAALTLVHNGMGWTWTARDKAGYERALLASEGVIDLLRSSQFGSRGLARLVFAGLRSYSGRSSEIGFIVQNEAELMKLVDSVTGDGMFKVDMKKQAAERTVTVMATGKKFSDVVPVATILPGMGAAFYFMMRGEAEVSEVEAQSAVAVPAPAEAATPPPAVKGLDVRSVYRAVKRP